jgi:hypothetical protein
VTRAKVSGARPWMRRTATSTIAATSSRWMKPPSVYELTSPSTHSTSMMIAKVQSIPYLHVRTWSLESAGQAAAIRSRNALAAWLSVRAFA